MKKGDYRSGILANESISDIDKIKVRFQALSGSEGYNIRYFTLPSVEPYLGVEFTGVVQKNLPPGEVPAAQQHTIA